MKQEIGFSQFCDAFSDTYKNNFTYAGKRALFDYLEELEQDTGSGREILKKSIKKIAKIAKTTFCPEKLHMKQKTPFYARKLF